MITEPLTVRVDDGWCVIERAQHDGRGWLDPVRGGFSFQCSSRISDADIEGTPGEMLELADAIEKGGRSYHKRCAVLTLPDGNVEMWSPRNSQRNAVVAKHRAMELAAAIRAACGKEPR